MPDFFIDYPSATAAGRPNPGLASHIAVFRAQPLGGMVCAVPALRALRHLAPRATITLISAPWAEEFASRFRCYIDDFLAFPGHPDLDGRTRRDKFDDFVNKMSIPFDWLIQLHGDGYMTNAILARLKATHRAGFVSHSHAAGPYFLAYPGGHESERLNALISHLGGRATPELEWPLTTKDRKDLMHKPWRAALGSEPYIVVDIGGSDDDQGRFGLSDLIERLTAHLAVVLVNAENESWRTDGRTIQAPHLSLGALGALIADAQLVIAPEWGAGHIARALSVPSLTLVTDAEPARWCQDEISSHSCIDARTGLNTDRAWAFVRKTLLARESSHVY